MILESYQTAYDGCLAKIGGPDAIDSLPDRPKYEMMYAQEFFDALQKFNQGQMTFKDLQSNVKDFIEERVNHRKRGGSSSHHQPSHPPHRQAQPEPMPQPSENNPFKAPLEGHHNSHSSGRGMNVKGSNHSQSFSNDRGAFGSNNGRDNSGGLGLPPANRHEPRDIQPIPVPIERPIPIPVEGPETRHKIENLQRENGSLKQLNDELRRNADGLSREINSLKHDKRRLEDEIDRASGKIEQLERNSNVNHANSDAARELHHKVLDLESEIKMLNSENARLLDMVKSASSAPRQDSGRGQNFGGDMIAKETIENLGQRIASLEAENARLRNDISRGSIGTHTPGGRDQELEELRAENKKIRTEAITEIKTLQNKVLIAEEKAKATLDSYKMSVSTASLDYDRRHSSDIGSLLLSTHQRNNSPDYAKSFMFPRRLTSLSPTPGLFARDRSTYIADPISIQPQPFLRRSPPRQTSPGNQKQSFPQWASNRELPFSKPLYSNKTSQFSEMKRSGDYGSEIPIAPNGISISSRSIRPDPRPENRSRSRPRLDSRGTRSTYGDQYLSRVSGLYDESDLVDKGTLRREAVAKSSRSRQRLAGGGTETFLDNFHRKLKAMQV